tara:strand:+ start:280 stop:528 length:249 start_codon:yes stop_codon:yes gene_type:complete
MAKKTRKLSPWNVFVMQVKKQNPEKSFKEVLVLASELKKKGMQVGDYVKSKSMKAIKKIKKSLHRKPKKGKKSQKNKTRKNN